MLQSSQEHHFYTWSYTIKQSETDERFYPTIEEANEYCNQVRYIISILCRKLFSSVRLMTDLILLLRRLMNVAIKSGTLFHYLVIFYKFFPDNHDYKSVYFAKKIKLRYSGSNKLIVTSCVSTPSFSLSLFKWVAYNFELYYNLTKSSFFNFLDKVGYT